MTTPGHSEDPCITIVGQNAGLQMAMIGEDVDLFMGDCHILNLYGGDPLASRLDNILAAVCNAHIAQGVDASHIASAEPAVLVYCTGLWMLHDNQHKISHGLPLAAPDWPDVHLVSGTVSWPSGKCVIAAGLPGCMSSAMLPDNTDLCPAESNLHKQAFMQLKSASHA